MKFKIISEGRGYNGEREKSLKTRLSQVKTLDFLDSESFESGYMGTKKGGRWSKGDRNNVHQLSRMAGHEAWKQDKEGIKKGREIDGKKEEIDTLSKELEELEPEEKENKEEEENKIEEEEKEE